MYILLTTFNIVNPFFLINSYDNKIIGVKVLNFLYHFHFLDNRDFAGQITGF